MPVQREREQKTLRCDCLIRLVLGFICSVLGSDPGNIP
jgi:hypothetical protein